MAPKTLEFKEFAKSYALFCTDGAVGGLAPILSPGLHSGSPGVQCIFISEFHQLGLTAVSATPRDGYPHWYVILKDGARFNIFVNCPLGSGLQFVADQPTHWFDTQQESNQEFSYHLYNLATGQLTWKSSPHQLLQKLAFSPQCPVIGCRGGVLEYNILKEAEYPGPITLPLSVTAANNLPGYRFTAVDKDDEKHGSQGQKDWIQAGNLKLIKYHPTKYPDIANPLEIKGDDLRKIPSTHINPPRKLKMGPFPVSMLFDDSVPVRSTRTKQIFKDRVFERAKKDRKNTVWGLHEKSFWQKLREHGKRLALRGPRNLFNKRSYAKYAAYCALVRHFRTGRVLVSNYYQLAFNEVADPVDPMTRASWQDIRRVTYSAVPTSTKILQLKALAKKCHYLSLIVSAAQQIQTKQSRQQAVRELARIALLFEPPVQEEAVSDAESEDWTFPF